MIGADTNSGLLKGNATEFKQKKKKNPFTDPLVVFRPVKSTHTIIWFQYEHSDLLNCPEQCHVSLHQLQLKTVS